MKTRALSRTVILTIKAIACVSTGFSQHASRPQNDAPIYLIANHVSAQQTKIYRLDAPDQSRPAVALHQSGASPGQVQQGTEHGYASASLAFQPKTGRWYYARRSKSDGSIWYVDPSGIHHRVGKGLPRQYITKMALGPDGEIYALTLETPAAHLGVRYIARLVKIVPGKSSATSCIQVLGTLSSTSGFHPSRVYSGDMAFAANGDLYIFGTELDTQWQQYTKGHIYRVAAAVKAPKAPRPLHAEYLGPIEGMGAHPSTDSTIINGVAFQRDGSFILSASDKNSQTRTYFYRGAIRTGGASVVPEGATGVLPEGWVAGDLASACFPRLSVPGPAVAVQVPPKPAPATDWEQYVTLRTYQY